MKFGCLNWRHGTLKVHPAIGGPIHCAVPVIYWDQCALISMWNYTPTHAHDPACNQLCTVPFAFILSAIPSTTASHNHLSKGHQSDDSYHSDDDDDDDDKYASARGEIRRFARPEEVNQICTSLMQTGQGTSSTPSKKSSGIVLGNSQIKSDSSLSPNFGKPLAVAFLQYKSIF